MVNTGEDQPVWRVKEAQAPLININCRIPISWREDEICTFVVTLLKNQFV